MCTLCFSLPLLYFPISMLVNMEDYCFTVVGTELVLHVKSVSFTREEKLPCVQMLKFVSRKPRAFANPQTGHRCWGEWAGHVRSLRVNQVMVLAGRWRAVINKLYPLVTLIGRYEEWLSFGKARLHSVAASGEHRCPSSLPRRFHPHPRGEITFQGSVAKCTYANGWDLIYY